MSIHKHTPGPWLARKVAGTFLPGQIGWAIDYNEEQEQVVDYVYKEADARLIAAAPDLLDALENVIESWGLGLLPHEDSEALDQARAAIAKAKGESA